MSSLKKFFAVMLSILLMISGTGLNFGTENHLFSENSLTVHAADGYVDFDEATGTLTLHGNITSNIIKDVPVEIEYRKNMDDDKNQMVDGYSYVKKDHRDVRKIIADPGTVLPEDCSYLFANLTTYESMNYAVTDDRFLSLTYLNYQRWPNLESIDLSAADMSGVTNMNSMFFNCHSLTSLNMNGADTSNVTDMSSMFRNCTSLQSLNVSGFITNKVENMNLMFCNCYSLNELDLDNFNTLYVKDMSSMFKDCTFLSNLEISGFDTRNVVNMSNMFYGCAGLDYIPTNIFNTSLLESADSMFELCPSIETLNLSSFDTKKLTSATKMFCNCSHLNTVIVSDLWDISTLSSDATKEMFQKCKYIKGEQKTCYNENYTDGTYARIDRKDAPGYFTQNEKSTNGYIYLHEESGTLTLFGDVTKTMINEYKFNNKVKSISAADGCILPSDCSYMFGESRYYWENVSRINLSNADASNVKNANGMFRFLSASYIDISNLNFSKAEKMNSMFEGCSSLSSLNLKSIVTHNVTNMSKMFYDCWRLASITGLDAFDTSSVTDMSYMFANCSSLSSLDLSSFDTSNVNDMSNMFSDCYSLSSLDLSSFDTSNVNDMSCMFSNCRWLPSLDLSSFDTSNVNDMSYIFSRCQSLPSLDCSSFDTSNVTNMSNMFSDCNSLPSLDCSSFDTSNVTNMSNMFSDCSSLSSLDFSSFDTSNVNDMSCMFSNCRLLPSLDCSSFDTSNVTNMSKMFSNCKSLPSLDCSSFDTSNVTNMNGMFMNCSWLSSTDFIKHFNTSKVTDLGCFFFGCNNISSIDLSIFDTSSLTSIEGMFKRCNSLKSIDFTAFDTSKVTNMAFLFSGCSDSLINSIDFSILHTSNVTDMRNMFDYCTSLKTIDLSSFDTSKAVNINNMFSNCSSLETLDLSSFDTSNVIYMSGIFSECTSLKTIDLSSFDTSEVTDMSKMFLYCTSLKTIYITDKWSTEKVKSSDHMFYNCKSLTGSNGTVFNSEKTDMEYARLDKQNEPGYFSTIYYESFSICDETVSYFNQNDILGDGVFRFDPVNWTLYINGDCTYEHPIVCYTGRDKNLTIKLSGDSKLESDYEVIYSEYKEIIIEGNFYHLTAVSQKDDAITGPLTINNTILSVKAAKAALNGSSNNLSLYHTLKINNSIVNLNGKQLAVVHYQKGMKLNNCYVSSPKASYSFDNMGNMCIGSDPVKKLSITQNSFLTGARLLLAKDGTITLEIQFRSGNVNAAINQTIIPLEKRNNSYILSYSIVPKDYNKPLNLTFTDVSNKKNAKSFTLADMITTYKKYYINNTEAIDLINSLETYCKTAEEYFKNTASETGTPSVTEYNFIGYKKTDKKYNSSPVTGKTEHIKYAGTSLLLKDKTILRHYFRLENGMTPEDFMETYMEGSVSFELYLDNKLISCPDFNYSKNSSYIYVDVTEIGPAYLDNMYTLKIIEDDSTMEFTSGVLSYCNKVIDTKTSYPALKNVCKALYSYNNCAKKYLKSLR